MILWVLPVSNRNMIAWFPNNNFTKGRWFGGIADFPGKTYGLELIKLPI